jgi:transposase
MRSMKYVGLDVHKDSIAVAIAEGSGEVRFYGGIPMTVEALEPGAPPGVAKDVALRV